MPTRPDPTRLGTVTALRPATYAGVAAAIASVAAAAVIRVSPPLETVVAIAHLALTTLLYATAGALAARLGADGWRAGVFAGLIDAIVGHTIAFLIAAPPDTARMTLPAGVSATAENFARLQAWGAVLGAGTSVMIAAVAGAVGGRYMRRAVGRTP